MSKDIDRQHNYIFSKIKGCILFIYGYECQICSVKSIKLDVHHIDNNHYNNKPFNLIPLCSDCHKKVHSVAKVDFSEKVISNYSFLEYLDILLSDIIK